MSEWLKEAVLKTVVPKGTVGSKPTPSARKLTRLFLLVANNCSAYGEFEGRWLKALAC
jgi:hypothetical protein